MRAHSPAANPPATHSQGNESASPSEAVHLQAKDLPAFCPNPQMVRWSGHPRVFIDVTTTGAGRCPYCGTHYVFDGPAHAGH